ncbi:MAG: hypothetical protein RLZZ546_2833 [Bacteroidota bacterium]
MKVAKKEIRYAIVDIETTGGMAKRDRIIEIAVVIHDGRQVIDQFSSLINPQRSIPFEITRITGINDEMVKNAPKFFEVAKQFVLLTQDTIFVAHNVNFDYSFIKEEYDRLGYTFSKKLLCTVKLSRKSFPGLISYSLGNLIRHFGISVNARHRALDDALATAEIFGYIVSRSDQNDLKIFINKGIKETKLPESISLERLHSLPEKTGVYYFYDIYGNIIYVGKSINIRSRMMQHFGQITAKSEKMIRLTNDIDYVETGSELIALLLESEEIKIHNPQINKAQKTKLYPYYIYAIEDVDKYICFGINKEGSKGKATEKILSYYSSITSAKGYLGYIRELYQLCEQKLIVPHEQSKSCIYYSMGGCLGACRNLEDSYSYNERAELALEHLFKIFDRDFIIVTEGRNTEEIGLVLVKDQKYYGFGFITKEDADMGIEEMLESIEERLSTPECNMIIHQFLKSQPHAKLINIKKANYNSEV